jgi:hypothetical protein
MEPDTSTGLQSVSLPADKAPAKPARSAAKQADKNKAYSVGASLTSNANFYDIPVVK